MRTLYLIIICVSLWASPFATAHAQIGDDGFSSMPLPDSVFTRIRGCSFPTMPDARLRRSDLRYLRVLHVNLDGQTCQGELICNKAIADDLLDIFRQLYEARYPVQSIRLIDDFGADDERSMRANNTSCFCYRVVRGTSKPSKHALGMAVDLNPLYNPCVRTQRNGKRLVQPSTATSYVNRHASFPCRIDRSDLAYRLFTEHGFRWGGAWRTTKDYQHFEKE
ncbi:MAG: M15 family metallopeptidase [Bacteroidaceae bacterium]|nr:M15 family metallopeptidase [Bacteroidaceae bacterium]